MENYEGITYESQNGVLIHWGIKGQKWGIRRYQNPDGSLTPEGQKRYNDKVAKLEAKRTKLVNKQAAKARKDNVRSLKDDIANRKKALKKGEEIVDKNEPEHIKSKKREKLLKSNDPEEIYKNRHLLTTSELKERIDRINTERNLADQANKNAPKKKTAIDHVDTALKWGKKVNEIYEFTNSSVGKKVKEMLGLKTESDEHKYWAKQMKSLIDETGDTKKIGERADSAKKVYEMLGKT